MPATRPATGGSAARRQPSARQVRAPCPCCRAQRRRRWPPPAPSAGARQRLSPPRPRLRLAAGTSRARLLLWSPGALARGAASAQRQRRQRLGSSVQSRRAEPGEARAARHARGQGAVVFAREPRAARRGGVDQQPPRGTPCSSLSLSLSISLARVAHTGSLRRQRYGWSDFVPDKLPNFPFEALDAFRSHLPRLHCWAEWRRRWRRRMLPSTRQTSARWTL